MCNSCHYYITCTFAATSLRFLSLIKQLTEHDSICILYRALLDQLKTDTIEFIRRGEQEFKVWVFLEDSSVPPSLSASKQSLLKANKHD